MLGLPNLIFLLVVRPPLQTPRSKICSPSGALTKQKFAQCYNVKVGLTPWISAALAAESWESWADDGIFETLNYKIASGVMEICSGEFKRKMVLIERQLDELDPPPTPQWTTNVLDDEQ